MNTMFHHIPDELKARPQWVCWSLVNRGDKLTKLPVNPKTGQLASATDPDTWASFDEATKTAKSFNGIGYVFAKDDPYFGLDLDQGVDTDLINWFGTYAERSQSGRGCHIIGRGRIPGGAGRRTGGYELYDQARYFVMTGDIIHPEPITDCQTKLEEFIAHVFPPPKGVDLSRFISDKPQPAALATDGDLIERIRSSEQGPKFDRLFSGNTADYDGDQSRADAGLLAILRFWTGGDKAKAMSIFEQSALARRSKWWKRPDYRERTWASIDNGDVYEAPEPLPAPLVMVKKASPWRQVTIEHVASAIEGTIMDPITRAIISPTEPALPYEVGLIKCLVLCGAALTVKADKPRGLGGFIHKGSSWARTRIMTAGGQVNNFWGLLIGGSASGKDVGRVMEQVAVNNKWLIGTAGSEEGIADAYMNIPNGILSISEMMNWLDSRHWQSKAASFLTGAYNAGWFSHAMSSRSANARPRETDYCYPNIYAAVQPGILQDYASKASLDSGFLGRFLVAQMPTDFFGYPLGTSTDPAVLDICNQTKCLQAKHGDIIVPHRYNEGLVRMFMDAKATPDASWRRLVNEYYPRMAFLLSTAPGDDSPNATITDNGWRKASVLVQYFFGQAEAAFGNLYFDPIVSRFENLCQRILEVVATSAGQKCTKHHVSKTTGRGTRVKDRDDAIRELISRGLLTEAKINGVTWLATA